MGRPPRLDLHEALLEAARAEFAAHGLERARVEDITRRAGASKGAFYLHFATKEEALEEILQRFMGALEDQARRREEAEACFRRDHAAMPESELRQLQVQFDCQVDVELLETFWRNRQMLAVIEGTGGNRYHRALDDFRRRMHAFVAERMSAKQAAGWIRREADPLVLADVLMGTYEGFARRMILLKDRPDLEGWLRSFTELLYDGMLERPRPAATAPSPSRRAAGRTRAVRARRTSTGVTPGSRKDRP